MPSDKEAAYKAGATGSDADYISGLLPKVFTYRRGNRGELKNQELPQSCCQAVNFRLQTLQMQQAAVLSTVVTVTLVAVAT